MKSLALAAALGLMVSQAHAAGYEKSIMWGGKTGSMAGISTSWIEGADSLYFNPAGLVAKAPGQELSLNVSPTWATFKGPYNSNNDVVTSDTTSVVPLGFIYSNTINPDWAFGVGGFISGGSKVTYSSIDMAGLVNGSPETKTDLQIGELSAGVAWKPTSSLKIGAAYRYVMARANFSFFNRAYNGSTFIGIVNADLTDLKDQESAFRLGAQWALSDAWHLGLTYRSEVPLQATGSIGGNFYKATGLPIANGTVNSASAQANTVFPQAVTLGADHNFSDTWQGLAEVSWVNYARVDGVGIQTNTYFTGTGANVPIGNSTLQQNWKDQWNVRLAGNYMGWSWPVRFGYGLTTQVTSSDWARPTFTPPGVSHTFTLGSGHDFGIGSQKFEFNGAGEWTFVSGDGNGHAAGDNAASTTTDIRSGTFKASEVALHLGLAYMF